MLKARSPPLKTTTYKKIVPKGARAPSPCSDAPVISRISPTTITHSQLTQSPQLNSPLLIPQGFLSACHVTNGAQSQLQQRIAKYMTSNSLLVPASKPVKSVVKKVGQKLARNEASVSMSCDHDYFKPCEVEQPSMLDSCDSDVRIEDAVEEVVTSDCESDANATTLASGLVASTDTLETKHADVCEHTVCSPSRKRSQSKRKQMITAIVDDIENYETVNRNRLASQPPLDVSAQYPTPSKSLETPSNMFAPSELNSHVPPSNSFETSLSLQDANFVPSLPCPSFNSTPSCFPTSPFSSASQRIQAAPFQYSTGPFEPRLDLTQGLDLDPDYEDIGPVVDPMKMFDLAFPDDLDTTKQFDSDYLTTSSEGDHTSEKGASSVCSEVKGYESVDSPLSSDASSMCDFIMNDSFLMFPDLALDI